MRSRRTVGALLISLLVLGTMGTPAAAFDMKDKPIVLGPDNREAYQEYPPLVVPETAGVRHLPSHCKTQPTCDTIPFLLTVPSPDYLHKITLIISFNHGEAGENDLDIFLYATNITTTVWKGKRTDVTGAMVAGCKYNESEDTSTCDTSAFQNQGSAATASQPETMRLADMPPINHVRRLVVTTDEAESGVLQKWEKFTEYNLVVHLFSGASDYQIKATFDPVVIGFERPRSGFFQRFFGGDDSPSSSRSSPPLGGGTAPDSSGTELEPVKEPGADGPLAEHDLFAIKGQGAEDTGGLNPIIPVAIAIVLLGGGLGGFFFIRSRRRASEA